MDILLRTERLVLRRFTPSDVDLLVELDSDPQVMHFITGGRTTSRNEIESDVLPAFLSYYQRYAGWGFYAAHRRDGDDAGPFLGWFHLRPGPGVPPDEPELGYRLRRDVWGRGYASEGARALTDLAFAELGASRVNAETMVVNWASRRVMEKAGMRNIRTFTADWPAKIPGDEHGDVEYAVTREEWSAQRGRLEGSSGPPRSAPSTDIGAAGGLLKER